MAACPHPLVVHRLPNTLGPRWTRLFECADPHCTARPADHPQQLPCRWAWPLATGRAYGEAFPRRRCPACEHIRRAGKPDSQLAATLSGRRPA